MTDATVFLVDDDASVRDSLALLLSLNGFRTQVFADAAGFLDTYRPEWRGCLLTDLKMPDIGGIELQQAMQARQWRLPVIVLTATEAATATAGFRVVGESGLASTSERTLVVAAAIAADTA